MTPYQVRLKLRIKRWGATLRKGWSLRSYEFFIWSFNRMRRKK